MAPFATQVLDDLVAVEARLACGGVSPEATVTDRTRLGGKTVLQPGTADLTFAVPALPLVSQEDQLFLPLHQQYKLRYVGANRFENTRVRS